MEGFFFTLKTLLASAALLFVLQIKVAGLTLEERSEKIIYESAASSTLSGMAQGAIQAGKDMWRWADRMMSDDSKSNSSHRR